MSLGLSLNEERHCSIYLHGISEEDLKASLSELFGTQWQSSLMSLDDIEIEYVRTGFGANGKRIPILFSECETELELVPHATTPDVVFLKVLANTCDHLKSDSRINYLEVVSSFPQFPDRRIR